MTRFVIAAAAGIALAGTASANTSNVYVDGSSVHIRYGDLDLRTGEGRTQLHDRIHQGARIYCVNAPNDSFPPYIARNECYRFVVSSAVDQMNRIVRQ